MKAFRFNLHPRWARNIDLRVISRLQLNFYFNKKFEADRLRLIFTKKEQSMVSTLENATSIDWTLPDSIGFTDKTPIEQKAG